MRRNLPPSDFEFVAHSVLDLALNSGVCMWLLKTDIPDIGSDDDQVVGQPRPSFELSNLIIVLQLAQIAIWYHGKIES